MLRSLRFLLAEDSAADTDLIVRALRSAGFSPEWHRVETEADYLAALSPELDVILSDYAMPEFTGLRALELLNERGLEIPFIIVSGTIGEETAVLAMQRGATDYLLKDRLTRLGPAIERALEQGRLRRERKQAQEALGESERRFREQASMLDHAHEAIIVRDIHTRRITFWNKGAERLYGWTAAEADGRDIGTLLFAEPGVLAEIAKELLRTGESHGERKHVTKAGKKLTVSSHVTLVRDSEENPKSALVINIDVTEQKNLEAQFLRAQRMESIGTLASGVAHDLNNILAPIMMSIPILREEMTAEQREGILTTIEMSAERGAQIVKQVLTFGRGLKAERHPLHLDALVRELMKIVHETFPKNIEIERSMGPDLWPVLGDATQLHQVLLNLCINARDAMPDGGKLRLSARNLTPDANCSGIMPGTAAGPHVLLEVSDNGSGIPPEIIERIFDPFFTTKAIGQGTGLGLSTVLGIIKSHGGHITATSDAGNGTVFQIYLPAEAEHVDTRKASGPPASPPDGHGELILVVDDEEAVRRAAHIVLEAHGYRVLPAADGLEALAVFAENQATIAAVLTDLMMPLMDGVALIHTLRKLQPGIPVIASTGLGEKTRMDELKVLNIEAVLNKPFSAIALLRTVHDLLHSPAVGPQNSE